MSEENRSDEDQKAINDFLKNGGKIKKMKEGERSIPLDASGSSYYRRKKEDKKDN